MDEETKKIIQQQLASLPKTVQDAIATSNWQGKILDLAKRYTLHIDQTGELENETFLVMLGLEDSDKFESNLVANLGLSTLIAAQISQEVDALIFKPIRGELQQIKTEVENIEENPTKESILAGIEDPVPVAHPHESFQPLASQLAMPGPLDQGTPTPPAVPVIVETKNDLPVAAPTIIPTVTVMPNAGTSNIVHDRLSQMVQMAKKEIQVDVSKPTTPATEAPKPKDPYREAIN